MHGWAVNAPGLSQIRISASKAGYFKVAYGFPQSTEDNTWMIPKIYHGYFFDIVIRNHSSAIQPQSQMHLIYANDLMNLTPTQYSNLERAHLKNTFYKSECNFPLLQISLAQRDGIILVTSVTVLWCWQQEGHCIPLRYGLVTGAGDLKESDPLPEVCHTFVW